MSQKMLLRVVARGLVVSGPRYDVSCSLVCLGGNIWQTELVITDEAKPHGYPQHRFLTDDLRMAKGMTAYYMRTRVAEYLGVDRVGVVVLNFEWVQVD